MSDESKPRWALPDHQWKFDEIYGNKAVDSIDVSGNSDGTLYNVTHGYMGKTSYIEIDGLDDSYISFGNSIGQFGTKDFTVSFWFSSLITTDKLHTFDIIGNRTSSSHGNFFCIRGGFELDGDIKIPIIYVEIEEIFGDSPNNFAYEAATCKNNYLYDGNWHHVAVVRENLKLRIYIDGKLEDTASNPMDQNNSFVTIPVNIQNSNEFKIGPGIPGLGSGQKVDFYYLLIYKEALTDNEVFEIYTSLPNPILLDNETGFKIKPNHQWNFNEINGDIAKDFAGNANAYLSNVTHVNTGKTWTIQIDGSDSSYVRFGSVSPGIGIGQFGKEDFTVSFWFSSSIPTDKLYKFDILGNRTSSSHGNFFCIRGGFDLDGDTKIPIIYVEIDEIFGDDPNKFAYEIATCKNDSLYDGSWHYVAVIRQNLNLRIFVDGKLGEDTLSPKYSDKSNEGEIINIYSSNELKLGPSSSELSSGHLTSFYDLRIYKKALSSYILLEMFNFSPGPIPWKMLTPWNGEKLNNKTRIAFQSLRHMGKFPDYYEGTETFEGLVSLIENYQFCSSVAPYDYIGINFVSDSNNSLFKIETIESGANEYLYMNSPSKYQKCILRAANGKYVTIDRSGFLTASANNKDNAMVFAIDLTYINHPKTRLLNLYHLYKDSKKIFTPPKGIRYIECIFSQIDKNTFWNNSGTPVSGAADVQLYIADDSNYKIIQYKLFPNLKDSVGWSQEQYYKTIQCADIDGDGKTELVARFRDGLHVWKFNNQKQEFEVLTLCNDLSNENGWGEEYPEYYETIQCADIDGDGKAELVARFRDGLHVWKFNNQKQEFEVLTLCNDFSDENGWGKGHPEYYETIKCADVDGDGKAELVAHFGDGLRVWKFNIKKNDFKLLSICNDFSNCNQKQYYKTIQYADIDGDGLAELIIRKSDGVHIYKFSCNQWIELEKGPEWDNKGHWDQEQYYETIQCADIDGDGKAELVARSYYGIVVLKYSSKWEQLALMSEVGNKVDWSKHPEYYKTIQCADVDGDGQAEIIARLVDGLHVWKFMPEKNSFKELFNIPDLKDTDWGDGHPEYYETIQCADINGDGQAEIIARFWDGLHIWNYD